MIKLMLNRKKFNNYAFFCPVSRVHLTMSNPVGFANEVTPAILRALKSDKLIDVDNVVDIEIGTVRQKKEVKTEEAPTVKAPEKETAPVEEPKQEEAVKEEKETAEEKQDKKQKRGKRAEANPVDEAAM